MKIRDLEEDLRKHKETVAEDFKSVGNDMQSLYRYIEQITAVLKENKLIPEPREEMVSPRGKKTALLQKGSVKKTSAKDIIK